MRIHIYLVILFAACCPMFIIAQPQLYLEGSNSTTSDTVAIIKVNYEYGVGLSVNALTGTNSGIGGIFAGNEAGIYATSKNYGIYGIGNIAIFGEAPADGFGTGVWGSSSKGSGIKGTTGTGIAVEAYSTNGQAIDAFSDFNDAITAISTTGYGIKAVGGLAGVEGKSTKSFGVIGLSDTIGTCGKATKEDGIGVLGLTDVFRGRSLKGEADGANSIAVMGLARGANSTGVWGEGVLYDFFANGPGQDYMSSSSIRWKKNITAIDDPLSKIRSLRGVYFDWDEDHGGSHDLGMIAEEVGIIIPEIVVYDENGVDAAGLDYSKLTPLLIEGIKVLAEENQNMKKQINELKLKLEGLSGQFIK